MTSAISEDFAKTKLTEVLKSQQAPYLDFTSLSDWLRDIRAGDVVVIGSDVNSALPPPDASISVVVKAGKSSVVCVGGETFDKLDGTEAFGGNRRLYPCTQRAFEAISARRNYVALRVMVSRLASFMCSREHISDAMLKPILDLYTSLTNAGLYKPAATNDPFFKEPAKP